ncbi:hypothetical protein C8R43DRAFT_1232863 [Mycena crocata]|nr:hypothetical protein C8R43DRAFT_1232863 [Mycena crocata]
MDDIPPTKRRRTDDAAEETLLNDESTQFRLTKSMLSMHSSVFRDMFMMPLPPDEPTVESCPIVVLSGDTPEDWIHLLSAMYPKFLMTETPRLEFLAAILRPGKKYDFPLFRKDAMCRLKAEFPATLKGHIEMKPWTNVQEEAEDFMMLSVISLAREIGLHSILPATYYYIVSDKDYMDKILHDEELALNTTDRLVCLQGYIKALELQSQIRWLGLAWMEGIFQLKAVTTPTTKINIGFSPQQILAFTGTRAYQKFQRHQLDRIYICIPAPPAHFDSPELITVTRRRARTERPTSMLGSVDSSNATTER